MPWRMAISASMSAVSSRATSVASASVVPIRPMRRAMNGAGAAPCRPTANARVRLASTSASGSTAYQIHERQVVVGRVLGVAEQAGGDGPADLQRQLLQRRRQGQAHHRRRVLLGRLDEVFLAERHDEVVRRNSFAWSAISGRPGADVFAGVASDLRLTSGSRGETGRRSRAGPTGPQPPRLVLVVRSNLRQRRRERRRGPGASCRAAARSCNSRRAWRTYQSFWCKLVARPVPRRSTSSRSTARWHRRASVARL